jgi:hypothetical protein
MLKLKRSIVSRLAHRFRSRAVVELENLALRHQLHVLRRQRPGRLRLFTFDRLLWVLLYRLWPRCLETMVLVKPATVIQWHRQGFRLFWRWRSRSGRPSVEREIRGLIRQMSSANPLWGAPRIHGELLKLGIEVSQATVAKYMLRRRGTPSQNWRSFLRNHAQGIAAIDMFVVASASFRLLYVMIILAHDRRTIVSAAVHRASDRSLALAPSDRSLSVGHGAPVFAARPRRIVWLGVSQSSRSNEHHGSHHGTAITLAERLRRARERIDTARVSGSPRDLQRASSAPRHVFVRRLLPTHPHASFARQGLPRLSGDSASQCRKSCRHSKSRWLASSLRTSRRLIRLGLLLTNRCAGCRTTSPEDLCIGGFFRSRSGDQPLVVQIAAHHMSASI